MQTRIRCMMMRGGTSKGAYFLASDLPADVAARDKVLLAVMGSPDARQIDGIGGAHPLNRARPLRRLRPDPATHLATGADRRRRRMINLQGARIR